MLSIGSITVDIRKIYEKQIEIAENRANLIWNCLTIIAVTAAFPTFFTSLYKYYVLDLSEDSFYLEVPVSYFMQNSMELENFPWLFFRESCAVYLALWRHLYSYLYYVAFCRFLYII